MSGEEDQKREWGKGENEKGIESRKRNSQQSRHAVGEQGGRERPWALCEAPGIPSPASRSPLQTLVRSPVVSRHFLPAPSSAFLPLPLSPSLLLVPLSLYPPPFPLSCCFHRPIFFILLPVLTQKEFCAWLESSNAMRRGCLLDHHVTKA